MLIFRGVCLLCGSVALHFDPFPLVQGLAWRGFLGHFLLSQSAAAAVVVGRRADGDLSYFFEASPSLSQSLQLLVHFWVNQQVRFIGKSPDVLVYSLMFGQGHQKAVERHSLGIV